MIQFENIIGGKAVKSTDSFESFDPYTGKPWALIPKDGQAQVDEAVAAAKSAFRGDWRSMTATARGKLMVKLAELIARDTPKLADIETNDNGKLIAEMTFAIRSKDQFCPSISPICLPTPSANPWESWPRLYLGTHHFCCWHGNSRRFWRLEIPA